MKAIISFAFALVSALHLSAQIAFEDVTESAGLIEPLKGMMGHGAAWGDVDGNGYPDLFFGTFTGRPDSVYAKRGHAAIAEPDKLFLNQGNGTFKEVKDSPVSQYGRNSGAAFADFDNDGDLDLVVSHNSYQGVKEQYKTGNFLFENNGSGTFKDVTEKSGLDVGWPFTGRNTFVLDYDGDGLLDLFMQEDFVRAGVSGGHSRLMKNVGGLEFIDVTSEAGFPNGYREGLWGLGGFIADMNGDSWPDVFFAHSCRMFINDRDGTFHEMSFDLVDPKTKEPATTNPDWTCGADAGDLDNDGDMDLVIGDHLRSSDSVNHQLYVIINEGNDSNGDPIFRDITFEAGINKMSSRAPHVQLQDMDNDGWVDILSTVSDDFVYRNKGVKEHIPVFEKPVGSGFQCGIGYWASGPLADYDRDGRLDFIGPDWVPAFASPLLRNVSKHAQNYIAVKMELENSPNRNGIGASVEIFMEGTLGQKEGCLGKRLITVSNGYSSGYEAIVYFGLPNDKRVDIRVSMPAEGGVYTARSVKRNQMYIIRE